MIEAKIIEDSISEMGKRITTLQVKFHRFILPEFNTHRVFSRNFSSSRAIPTKKLLEQVCNDPAIPVHWGKNQSGMQAKEELQGINRQLAKDEWKHAAIAAAGYAETLANMGAHKQIVNRVIEPFLWVNGIVTSTEWSNWFDLRAHDDAQPEIHELALCMKEALNQSTPVVLKHDEWHLPYLTSEEKTKYGSKLGAQISAARCCRVSYLKHDGTKPNVDDDLALFERLAGAVPLHASPLEHQATPDLCYNFKNIYPSSFVKPGLHGNLQGWIQYRKVWEQEIYTSQSN